MNYIMYTSIIVLLSLMTIVSIVSLLFYRKSMKNMINILTMNLNKKTISRPLSFEECNTILYTVINDIYENKYKLYYRLKEIDIIPNLDEEILNMSHEVLAAFSEDQFDQFRQYYTDEYLGQLIVRQIQILFIDYTRKNKPNVG